MLNKQEKRTLIRFLKQEIRYGRDCPYELLTILENLNPGDYEHLFSTMKSWKEVDTLFNKMVEPSEEELTTLLGLSE